jgi:hypothetical protein
MVFWHHVGTNAQGDEVGKIGHETMGTNVLSDASPSVLLDVPPLLWLKRGPKCRTRLRRLPKSTRRLHLSRQIFWPLVMCFQGSQHLAFRCKRLPRKCPLVAVIAAVFPIVMASLCIEPAAVSMHRTRCQRNGRERK